MNNVNKTLYIPLYGKAYVSRKGIILQDKTAEKIWAAEGFPLKGKSKSKWLAYYMGMRAAVFDRWLRESMEAWQDAVILHIGCGMDSRIHRVGNAGHLWFDIDFPEVVAERSRYYEETDGYHIISGDIRSRDWLTSIPKGTRAVIVMEGVSMYLTTEELQTFLGYIGEHFESIAMLMDCYTTFAAKASRYKNPINDVGVTQVYGIDEPALLNQSDFRFVKEHEMTPEDLIAQLSGTEKRIFRRVFAGRLSHKMYRLYEFRKT